MLEFTKSLEQSETKRVPSPVFSVPKNATSRQKWAGRVQRIKALMLYLEDLTMTIRKLDQDSYKALQKKIDALYAEHDMYDFGSKKHDRIKQLGIMEKLVEEAEAIDGLLSLTNSKPKP